MARRGVAPGLEQEIRGSCGRGGCGLWPMYAALVLLGGQRTGRETSTRDRAHGPLEGFTGFRRQDALGRGPHRAAIARPWGQPSSTTWGAGDDGRRSRRGAGGSIGRRQSLEGVDAGRAALGASVAVDHYGDRRHHRDGLLVAEAGTSGTWADVNPRAPSVHPCRRAPDEKGRADLTRSVVVYGNAGRPTPPPRAAHRSDQARQRALPAGTSL